MVVFLIYPKVRFIIYWTNFSNHYNPLYIKMKTRNTVLWETTASWNIKVKNIFEKRGIEFEINEDENFKLFI